MLSTRYRNRYQWSEEITEEALDLWNGSIVFFNYIDQIVSWLPEDARQELVERLQTSTLSIPDSIAQGVHSGSKEDFQSYLDDAQEFVSATIGSLMMAKNWKYINERLFDEAYQKGKRLTDKIQSLSESIYSVAEMN